MSVCFSYPMNYLAHTLLSPKDIDYQLGNLLADTLKGRPWPGCSRSHLAGLAMHKAIDKFTDENHVVERAISRLGSGYLKGVVVDITFDHFLSKHWDHFVNVPQSTFIEAFYQQAEQNKSRLPPKGLAFIESVINFDILNAYESFDHLAQVLTRVNHRLSEHLLSKESATDYLPRLAAKYDELEDDFLAFFPSLVSLFLENTQIEKKQHYFKVV